MKRHLLSLLIALLVITPLAGCAAPREKTPLVVFIAGSLMIPFDALEKAFEAKYPQIDVQMEAHGSIQVIRHVTDIGEKIDVVASADHSLLPTLMYAKQDPDTGKPYASWYIRFASNRMALAYGPKSRYAGELNADNWYEILRRPGVKIGLSDPRFDAAGYRQLMIYQLVEMLYGKKTYFADMLMGRFTQPITVNEENGVQVIRVPEVLETRPNSTLVMRGASVQLIPLLESGDVDYIFEYESVVRQHKLAYISLPDELNLGAPAQVERYRQVSIKLDFQRFASVKPEFRGDVIGYGIAIPSNAPHPDAAAQFVAFLLGPDGRRVMSENDHTLLQQAVADNYANVPAALKKLCVAAP
jgi:molybdate/tungstate transport system substrate-binding protein